MFSETTDNHIQAKEPANIPSPIHKSFWGNIFGDINTATKAVTNEVKQVTVEIGKTEVSGLTLASHEISHTAKIASQDLERTGRVTSVILAGAGKEIIDHPLIIAKDITLGMAVGAIVSVAPVVGLVFLGLGLASVIENRKKLVDNALALKASIGIEYNPAGTSMAQQNEAKQCLEDFGSGSAQLAAGLAGGITGAKFGGPILENITQSLLSKLPPEVSNTLEFASLAKFTDQITPKENLPVTITQETPAVISSDAETTIPITLNPDNETIDPTSIAKEPIKAIKLINKINKAYRDINEKADPHYKLASKHLTPIQVLKIFDFSHHSSAFLTSSALGLNSNYIN